MLTCLCVTAASGTLMLFSSRNNTLLVIRMIHSSWKVWLTLLLYHECYCISFQLIIVLYFYSSFNYQGTSWRLCWAGEAYTRVWWLPVQGVCHWNRIHVLTPQDMRNYFSPLLLLFFSFYPADMDMIGKERKLTKIFCELTQPPFPRGCFTY